MKRSVHLLLLALLTAAALGLRLTGLDWGLPMELELDCKIPIQVEMLREDVPNPEEDREFNWYPLLLARVVAALPGTPAAPLEAPIGEHLQAAKGIYLQTRIVMALLAAAVVPLTWLLARLWLSRAGALVAAALVATSLLHLSFSQQARPHAPSATFFLAAVLAAVYARRADRWPQHLALGVACFLAVGCLQSGVLVVPAAVLAYALRDGGARRLLDGRVLIPVAGAVLAVPVFYPFVFAGDLGQREGQEHVFDLAGHMIFLDQFNGAGFGVIARTLWSYDPALLVLLALAAVVWTARRARRLGPAPTDGCGERGDRRVALAFFVTYLVVFGLYERNYERFVIALLPYFACGAAWALWTLARGPVRVALACLALALPAVASVRLAQARAAPHTTARAAAWLEEHAAPEADVLLTSKIDLPLFREPEGMLYWNEVPTGRRHYHIPWTRYQARLPGGRGPEPRWGLRWISMDISRYMADARGFLAEQGGDYAVAEVYAENRAHPVGTLITEAFRANGELLARISPDGRDDYSEHPLGSQPETSVPNPHFTLRVLQARSFGPVIEIYRLNPSER